MIDLNNTLRVSIVNRNRVALASMRTEVSG